MGIHEIASPGFVSNAADAIKGSGSSALSNDYAHLSWSSFSLVPYFQAIALFIGL